LDTETNSFDLLKAIKRAEPLAFLASLSLVISAFSFQGLGNLSKIYGYSVVSAFMFIFSFLFSIAAHYLILTKITQRLDPYLKILQRIMNFGIYFFLIIGMLFLILIAYQFGQSQPQIFTITYAFLGSFIFYMSITIFFKLVKELVKGSGSPIFYLIEIIALVGVIFVSSLSISSVVEAILDLKGITRSIFTLLLNPISPFFGLCFGALISIPPIQILKKRRLQTISKYGLGVIIFFIIVGATFIVLSSISLSSTIPLVSNTE
jgi:hypothetical protein